MIPAIRARAVAAALSPAALLALALASHGARAAGEAAPFADQDRARILRQSPLGEPPADPTNAHGDDPAAAQLGQFLFFDKRLSADGQVSCGTCHDPARSFTDGKTVSTHERHVPSLWNVAWQRWLFWDGSADSLWSQALQPIEDETEMDGDRTASVYAVWRDKELRSAFETVFGPLPDMSDSSRFPAHARPVPAHPEHPDHVAWIGMRTEDRTSIDRAFANVGKALAAYQRRLVSRSSEFDRFVDALKRDDQAAQSEYGAAARRGLALFVGKADCRLCHAGPNFSDNEFHNIGVPPLDRKPPRDAGRYAGVQTVRSASFNAQSAFSDDRRGERARDLDALAHTAELWGQFKTPTLRNVARTAPYMHQGQIATLAEVVQYYSTLEGSIPVGHHGEQVIKPLNLTAGEMADIVAFLETLTDEAVPPELLSAPSSPRWTPPAGPTTGREP